MGILLCTHPPSILGQYKQFLRKTGKSKQGPIRRRLLVYDKRSNKTKKMTEWVEQPCSTVCLGLTPSLCKWLELSLPTEQWLSPSEARQWEKWCCDRVTTSLHTTCATAWDLLKVLVSSSVNIYRGMFDYNSSYYKCPTDRQSHADEMWGLLLCFRTIRHKYVHCKFNCENPQRVSPTFNLHNSVLKQ